MNIRQVQHHERTPKVDSSSFIGDAVAYLDNEPLPPQQHVFTGPMTIRVHESDGSPYEHIVELKEQTPNWIFSTIQSLERLKEG